MLILSSARPLSNSEVDKGSHERTPHGENTAQEGENSKARGDLTASAELTRFLPSFLSVLSHIIYNQERRRVRGESLTFFPVR